MTRLFAAALASALSLFVANSPAFAQQHPGDRWAQTGTMDGRIEPGDRTFQDGTRHDLMIFEGKAGEKVDLTMTAADFAPCMMLVNGDSGKELTSSAKSSDPRVSKISATLPVDATWTVIAYSCDARNAGSYRIRFDSSLTHVDPNAPSPDDGPTFLFSQTRMPCTALRRDNLTAARFDSSSSIEGLYVKFFCFPLSAGETIHYLYRYDSAADMSGAVFADGSVPSNFARKYEGQSTLTGSFTARQSGNYVLMVGTRGRIVDGGLINVMISTSPRW